MDLQVALERLLAFATRCPALGVEALRQVGDRPPKAPPDSCEMLLVRGYQRGIPLCSESVGKVKRTCSGSHDRRFCYVEGALRQAPLDQIY
jgi:hypothetical protein